MVEENESAESTPEPERNEGTSEPERNVANEVTATFAKLGGGERLAVLGAAIVVGGWLLFDLLIDEYRVGHLPLALGAVIVGAAYIHHRRKSGSDPVPYRPLLLVLAALLGLLGATDFIEEARNNIFDTDATTIFGALVYYVGSIMSGVGAIQLRN